MTDVIADNYGNYYYATKKNNENGKLEDKYHNKHLELRLKDRLKAYLDCEQRN